MIPRSILAIVFALSGFSADVTAQTMSPPSRGELLYATHCLACHTDKVHWRDHRVAGNFNALRYEVRRWQKMSTLGWNAEDIEAVARYLNTVYYHYPVPD
jgi:mono/diheme cytochrome c family protein